MKPALLYQACRRRHIPGMLIGIIVCCPAAAAGGQARAHGADNATHDQVGHASWYGPGFHGKKTASGKRFDGNELTAAHPSLPLGTTVEVTNLANNKKVDVVITDRGPHDGRHAIDVSERAAEKLKMKKSGRARVKITAKKPQAQQGSAARQSRQASVAAQEAPSATGRP